VVTGSCNVESVAGACIEKWCSVIRFGINSSSPPPLPHTVLGGIARGSWIDTHALRLRPRLLIE
jgi:hypothetical protein